MEAYGNEVFDSSTSVSFLIDHSNLKWKQVKRGDGRKCEKTAVKTENENFSYYFGRVVINGSVNVGKITSDWEFYVVLNGTSHTYEQFEVLVCE
jgi:hypothetical protein